MAHSGNITAVGVGDPLNETSPAAAAREAALMLLLHDLAATAEAQREVLAMLGREVTATSDFIEARVGAICGQLRRLLPASPNVEIGRRIAGAGTPGDQAPPAAVDPRIGHTVSSLITEVQFQDRARQRLQFVVDTLSILAECSSEIDDTIVAGLYEQPANLPKQYVEFTARAAHDSLRRIRERIAASVPAGGPAAAYGGDFPKDEGIVDLF